ncbi:MAG: hypothetical protein ABIJ74_03365 [archaeon]
MPAESLKPGTQKKFLYFLFIAVILIPLINAQTGLILFEGETDSEPPPMNEPQGNEMLPEGIPPMETFGDQPVPDGCRKVDSGTGIAGIECDFDFDEPEFNEFDLKQEIENCDGKFEMINGKPACIKEGKQGFTGTACPTEKELNSVKANCKGKAEEFTDEKGCKAVMCVNQEFKEKYDEAIKEKYSDDPVKAQAIQCQKDGGQFMMIKDKPTCIMEFNDPIGVKPNSREITPQEMAEVADRLNAFQERIAETGKKLEKIKQGYKELGETEAFQAVEYAIQKMGEIQLKISSMKSQLNSGDLTQEEMNQIRIDIQSIRKEISKAVKAVATGKVPSLQEIEEAVAQQFDKFYGSPFGSEEEFQKFVEAEKGALEIVRGCDKYSAGNEKEFVPPDPEGFVVKVQLLFDGENCLMTLNTKEGKKAQFALPENAYRNFSDPRKLVNFSCSGDCDALKEMFSKTHGTGSPEEACMEECIVKDCDEGQFACMQKNMDSCELECGLRGEGEGPFVNGELDPFQGCIMICAENRRCEPGGSDPVCVACEEKCMAEYGPGIGYEHCLNAEQLEALQETCIANKQYAETIESPTPDGKSCISGVECKNYDPSEWGDNPGTGPDNWEEGHPPRDYGPPTGQIVLPGLVNDFIEWLKGWFK